MSTESYPEPFEGEDGFTKLCVEIMTAPEAELSIERLHHLMREAKDKIQEVVRWNLRNFHVFGKDTQKALGFSAKFADGKEDPLWYQKPGSLKVALYGTKPGRLVLHDGTMIENKQLLYKQGPIRTIALLDHRSYKRFRDFLDDKFPSIDAKSIHRGEFYHLPMPEEVEE